MNPNPNINAKELLQHMPAVRRMVLHILHNLRDADDIGQDVLEITLRKIRKAGPIENLRGWMVGVAEKLSLRNLNQLLKEQKIWNRSGEQDSAGAIDLTPVDITERLHATRDVTEALENLPDPFRTVLFLHNHDEKCFKEIGRILNCTTESAKTNHRRGLRMLEAMLLRKYGDNLPAFLFAVLGYKVQLAPAAAPAAAPAQPAPAPSAPTLPLLLGCAAGGVLVAAALFFWQRQRPPESAGFQDAAAPVAAHAPQPALPLELDPGSPSAASSDSPAGAGSTAAAPAVAAAATQTTASSFPIDVRVRNRAGAPLWADFPKTAFSVVVTTEEPRRFLPPKEFPHYSDLGHATVLDSSHSDERLVTLRVPAAFPSFVNLLYGNCVLDTQLLTAPTDAVSFTVDGSAVEKLQSSASVQVLDLATGRPIPGARVFLSPAWSTLPSREPAPADGRWKVENLPPGLVYLKIEAPGYPDYLRAYPLSPGSSLRLPPVHLDTGRLLSGRVLDPSGQPFPQGGVRIVERDADRWIQLLNAGGSVLVKSEKEKEGEFTVRAPRGRCLLFFQQSPLGQGGYAALPVPVEAGGDVTGLELRVVKATAETLRPDFDEMNSRLVQLWWKDGDLPVWIDRLSGRRSRVSVDLPPGDYRVDVGDYDSAGTLVTTHSFSLAVDRTPSEVRIPDDAK